MWSRGCFTVKITLIFYTKQCGYSAERIAFENRWHGSSCATLKKPDEIQLILMQKKKKKSKSVQYLTGMNLKYVSLSDRSHKPEA